jgi:hypothetical protein
MPTCFICNKLFSKGIGICCSRQCHNKRINSRSRQNDKHVLIKKNKILEYESNPTLCVTCNLALTYKQRNNKFCSHSCRARITNSARDQQCYKKQSNSLRSTLAEQGFRIKYPSSNVCFKFCSTCNKPFRSIKGRKYCSEKCKVTTDIKIYRRACKFKIDKTLNPDLYNQNLLTEYGWYRAANHPLGYNPNGATWDHLFRIEDGFKLGISPEIMKHPANAEMVSWKENFARKTSSISLEELLTRIKNWKK